MYRHVVPARRLELARRRRASRTARYALERELLAYASDADRNDLEVLVADSGMVGGEAAAILARQAGARLFRSH